MIDISIDIETLASGTNAALTQIGAVYRVGPGRVEQTFFAEILDPNGTFSPATMQWHREQGGVALPGPKAEHVSDVLRDFGTWLRRALAEEEGKARLWTHATFDIPRIADAYDREGYGRPPWHYRNCRDLRTLYDLAGGRPNLPAVGVRHNALDDAIYQLNEVEYCLDKLGLSF